MAEELPRAPHDNGHKVERRAGSFHNTLAMAVVLIFAAICFATYGIVTGKHELESWAAGIVGAILGYWANNLTQIISYYYGASSPLQQAPHTPQKKL